MAGESRACFSNRPFEVKHFQTIHHCSVDVARRLVLLYGIGTKALPSWDSRTRRNNLLGGLAVRRTAGPSRLTNSPHPSSREGHLSTAGWNSGFLLSGLILNDFHAAAAACSRVHRNSVPSTQMRCMITASRRARATIAFFIPRRLAICIEDAATSILAAADALKDGVIACKAEINGVCGKVKPGEGRIATCLLENKSTASAGCAEAIAKVQSLAAEKEK